MSVYDRKFELINATAEYFGITQNQLMSDSHAKTIVKAKRMLVYWVMNELKLSQHETASLLKGVVDGRSSIPYKIKIVKTKEMEEFKQYRKQMSAMWNQKKHVTFEKEEKVNYMSCFIDGQNQYREEKVYCFVANDNGSMVVELRTKDGFKPVVQREKIKKGW